MTRATRAAGLIAWLALGVLALAGCGQMGPLTLPADAENGDEEEEEEQDERENGG